MSDSEVEVVSKEASLAQQILESVKENFARNREEELVFFTQGREKTTKELCYVGIDEAGRGPVLGPMVYGIFAAAGDPSSTKKAKGDECPALLIDAIKKLDDSKKMTEKWREDVFTELAGLDHVAFGFVVIPPAKISAENFRRQKVSLNDVSHRAAMDLIQGLLDQGVKIGKVFVDTVGPMDKYQRKLELKFPTLKFKVDKKADSKYKPVSAASVVAKVVRDYVLKNWEFSEDIKIKSEEGWGSGYPGDPVTKRFLRKNIDPVFGFPNVTRDCWSTAADLLKTEAVPVKWEEEEEEGGEPPAQKISKFFHAKKTDDEPCGPYFKSLFLTHRGIDKIGDPL